MRMTDQELITAIQCNIDVQKSNKFDSAIATQAREANRSLFVEAAKRNLQGAVT